MLYRTNHRPGKWKGLWKGGEKRGIRLSPCLARSGSSTGRACGKSRGQPCRASGALGSQVMEVGEGVGRSAALALEALLEGIELDEPAQASLPVHLAGTWLEGAQVGLEDEERDRRRRPRSARSFATSP